MVEWHDRTMTQINLIVAADEPAIFFASVKDAERWMEPIDVADGVYSTAFGPAGEPYIISTDGKTVVIRPAEGVPQPETLKVLLVRYFAATSQALGDDTSLSSLLNRCVPSYR